MASKIPIGLIDLSLGGTTLEAWLSPNTLLSMPENNSLLKQWNDKEAAFNPVEDLKTKISNWEKRTAEQKRKGEETAPKPLVASVRPALDRNFPGSSYTGMVAIIGGLSVKGVVFHQGYNNALGDARPKLYAANFKALISDWRNLFNNKQLPFGIIEFSAGGEPQTLDNYELRMLDPSPYIREGQFNAYRGISNTGYACAYDQQVNWYHPQKKVELGERMARWALSTQYGFNLGWEPAVVEGIEKLKDKIIVTFSKQVKSSDDRPMEGFSIAGIDRHFYPAKAEYLKMQNEKGQKVNDKRRVIVWNDLVENPIELRYAWARNPLGNLVNDAERIIPVPLFRTDNWDYPEAPYLSSEYELYRQKQKTIQQQAEQLARIRIIQEAEKLIKENKK
jgi:sialate O-acetylesterase